MDLIQILMGGLGSLGFGVLFHLRRTRLLIATIGGLMSWTVFLVLAPLFPSEAVRYFFSAAAVTVYSEVFARVIKTPTTTFLVPSLIPLIPGGSLYYTMASLFGGNLSTFLDKAVYTLELAVSLALGIVLVTAIAHTVTRLQKPLRKS